MLPSTRALSIVVRDNIEHEFVSHSTRMVHIYPSYSWKHSYHTFMFNRTALWLIWRVLLVRGPEKSLRLRYSYTIPYSFGNRPNTASQQGRVNIDCSVLITRTSCKIAVCWVDYTHDNVSLSANQTPSLWTNAWTWPFESDKLSSAIGIWGSRAIILFAKHKRQSLNQNHRLIGWNWWIHKLLVLYPPPWPSPWWPSPWFRRISSKMLFINSFKFKQNVEKNSWSCSSRKLRRNSERICWLVW